MNITSKQAKTFKRIDKELQYRMKSIDLTTRLLNYYKKYDYNNDKKRDTESKKLNTAIYENLFEILCKLIIKCAHHQNKRKCSVCKKFGHNKRTCKSNLNFSVHQL